MPAESFWWFRIGNSSYKFRNLSVSLIHECLLQRKPFSCTSDHIRDLQFPGLCGHEASQLSSQLTAELTATSWNLLFAVPFVLRSLSEFSRQFCITTVTMYLAFIIPHCMCALLRPRLRSALTLILLCNCSLSADGRNLSVFAKGYCFSFHCCPE